MAEAPEKRCVGCGAVVFGPYCAQCGEVTGRHDYSLKHFAGEIVEVLTELDGRILWTFRALLAKPGVLVRDFLDGRRKNEYGPVKVFAICNIVYFLVQPFTLFAPFTSTVVALPFFVYLLIADRVAYCESWGVTIVKTALLSAWAIAVLTLYRFVLFFTVFYAT